MQERRGALGGPMTPRHLAALLLAFALAPFAGCLDGADASEGASTAPAPEAEGDAPATTRQANTAATPARAAPGAPTVVMFETDGQTGLVAYVCAYTPVAGQCLGGSSPVHDHEAIFPAPRVDGTLEAVDLVLTWDARTPLGESLTLGLAVALDGETEWIVAAGASPLRLDETLLGIPPEAEVSVYVWTECDGALAVFVCATDPQPFRIEGTFTYA